MIDNVESGRHVEIGQCPVSTNDTTRYDTDVYVKRNETAIEMKPIEQILLDGFNFQSADEDLASEIAYGQNKFHLYTLNRTYDLNFLLLTSFC